MRTELIRASELLRQNTPESVEQAIGLLQNTVFSFSMKMCGHREDAEDTMQEVLIRSIKHLSKLDNPNALAAWLYTVTRNRCHRMRRRPLDQEAHKVSIDDLMPDDEELKALLEGDGSPERRAMHAEESRLLHEAVLHIPTPLRLVLVLHDMEELSSEQIAEILGLQVGTVRVRLHRARLAVRKQMATLLKGLPDAGKKVNHSAKSRPAECRKLFANLSEYLDKRVEPRTCDEMKSHIEKCPACIAFLNDLREAVDRCRSLQVECDPAVARRIRDLMTQEYLRLVGQEAQNR